MRKDRNNRTSVENEAAVSNGQKGLTKVIHVDKDLHKQFKKCCVENNISLGEMSEQLIKSYINQQSHK